jgi:hypothetical protein
MAAQVSFLIAGGTDAPGIRIVPDGHGGWKIVKVPGWNPEQMVELGAALQVVAAGGRLKHADTAQAVLKSAGRLAQSELATALGKDAENAHVVVVFAGG